MAYTCELRVGDRIVLKPWEEVATQDTIVVMGLQKDIYSDFFK